MVKAASFMFCLFYHGRKTLPPQHCPPPPTPRGKAEILSGMSYKEQSKLRSAYSGQGWEETNTEALDGHLYHPERL